MYFNFNIITVTVFMILNKNGESALTTNYVDMSSKADNHKGLTYTNVYPYVVAVLKKSSLLSTGALITDRWVITSADPLFLLRDATRLIQIRLGSMNYKKGGHVCPVKYIEIHPEFNDETPEFDIAMLRLAMEVQYSQRIYPIRLQSEPKDITSTHFLVTYWKTAIDRESIQPMYRIIERRRLQISHLHPSNENSCKLSLAMNANETDENLLCFDLSETDDPCKIEYGGPVVLNRFLWGIMSSWVPHNCQRRNPRIYATKMFAPDILSWIHAVIMGASWISPMALANNTVAIFNYDEYF